MVINQSNKYDFTPYHRKISMELVKGQYTGIINSQRDLSDTADTDEPGAVPVG